MAMCFNNIVSISTCIQLYSVHDNECYVTQSTTVMFSKHTTATSEVVS